MRKEASDVDLYFRRAFLEPLRKNLEESLSELVKRVSEEVQTKERERSNYPILYADYISAVMAAYFKGEYKISGEKTYGHLKELNKLNKERGEIPISHILLEDFLKITQEFSRLIEEGKLDNSLHLDIEELVYKKIREIT